MARPCRRLGAVLWPWDRTCRRATLRRLVAEKVFRSARAIRSPSSPLVGDAVKNTIERDDLHEAIVLCSVPRERVRILVFVEDERPCRRELQRLRTFRRLRMETIF